MESWSAPPNEISQAGGRAEDELVRQARLGDADAFEELVTGARGTCLSIATAILGNHDDAQDEVQNALWKAYTHLDSFSQQSRFSTWVTRIVINHCLMRYRRLRRLSFVSYDGLTSEGELYLAHPARTLETPEEGLGKSELRSVLQMELHRLPVLLREPLELRYLHDLPPEAVAQRLGISVAAMKSRLHRAQSYLKDRMLRHCGKRGAATLTRCA